MRLAKLAGRSTIVTDDGLIDVASSSNGAFSASTDKCIGQMEKLRSWYETFQPSPSEATKPEALYGDPRLGLIVTSPPQVFAVGLNYRQHANEMGLDIPTQPMIFTKFQSSLCGPNEEVPIPSSTTDFEAELVVVLGATARNLNVDDALGAVAGYCVGQDFSDRTLQMKGTSAQFSLAKSFRNFSPIGPWLTTADELAFPNSLSIGCSVNGSQFQQSTTSDMVFSVAEIVSYLSSIIELRTGDLIFTGSPHGVGHGRTPAVFLKPGDRVVTEIEKLGRIENVTV